MEVSQALRVRRGAIAVGAMLVLGSSVVVPVRAEGGKTHSQTEAYAHPHGVRTGHEETGLGTYENVGDPLVFYPKKRDRSVLIEVSDAASGTLLVYVSQDADGKNEAPLDAEFCNDNSTFKLVSSEPVEVTLYSGFCNNHLYGVSSSGEVTATFSTKATATAFVEHDH